MSITAWILTAGFATLVLLGMPFAFAIALSVIAVLLVVGIEPMLLPQTMVAGTQSFSLLAIPFFMLAGELMLARVPSSHASAWAAWPRPSCSTCLAAWAWWWSWLRWCSRPSAGRHRPPRPPSVR